MSKVWGWDEAVTTCDCCGRTDLSGTFAVELDDGAVVHYGSVCVKRNTGIKNPAKAANDHERERTAQAATRLRQSDEHRAYRAAIGRVSAMVDRGEVAPGAASAALVRAEGAALQIRVAALKAEFRVNHIPD